MFPGIFLNPRFLKVSKIVDDAVRPLLRSLMTIEAKTYFALFYKCLNPTIRPLRLVSASSGVSSVSPRVSLRLLRRDLFKLLSNAICAGILRNVQVSDAHTCRVRFKELKQDSAIRRVSKLTSRTEDACQSPHDRSFHHSASLLIIHCECGLITDRRRHGNAIFQIFMF